MTAVGSTVADPDPSSMTTAPTTRAEPVGVVLTYLREERMAPRRSKTATTNNRRAAGVPAVKQTRTGPDDPFMEWGRPSGEFAQPEYARPASVLTIPARAKPRCPSRH